MFSLNKLMCVSRRQWQSTPVLLPGKSHEWRSLAGYSSWDCYESDTTERLHFHFSLSSIGEGNGNPLQFLAGRIPGTGEPGGLPSMGSHRVGHNWSDLAAAAAATALFNMYSTLKMLMIIVILLPVSLFLYLFNWEWILLYFKWYYILSD